MDLAALPRTSDGDVSLAVALLCTGVVTMWLALVLVIVVLMLLIYRKHSTITDSDDDDDAGSLV